jgi:hypothetical protein
MSLTDALGDWLTDNEPGALLHKLAEAGPDGQWRATLLEAHLEGVRTQRLTAPTAWAGGLAFLGAAPPKEAPQGSLWFDPRELQLHLLVARDPGEVPKGTDPALSWLSTEPARLFQWRSFLENAFMERGGAHPDFIPFLPRDFQGPEMAAATGMSAPEARLYAVWLGKALPSLYDWECAAQLGDHRLQDLWAGAATREWLSDNAGDDSVCVAAGPSQWDIDPSDQFDDIELGNDPSREEQIVFPRATRTAEFGFRTRVLVQFGLVDELSDRGATACGQRLVAKAAR